MRRPVRTEEDWRACEFPHQLVRLWSDKASDRKARLFESACLRRLQHWPVVEAQQWAVEVVERHADGAASPEEVLAAAAALRAVRESATWVMGGMWNQAFDEMEDHESGAWPTAGRTAEAMNIAAGRLTRAAAGLEEDRPDDDQRAAEQRAQCDLLRCILGNPFSPAAIHPAVLAWRDGSVGKVALAVYDERTFAELPILADALEEAGCTAAAILDHCRGPGPHVRGCWVLDLILGKE
jgi:hypothetical protein